MDATDWGWAVFFAVPIGVGVTLAALKSTGRPLGDPLVFGTGLVAALSVFSIVVAAVATGPEAE